MQPQYPDSLSVFRYSPLSQSPPTHCRHPSLALLQPRYGASAATHSHSTPLASNAHSRPRRPHHCYSPPAPHPVHTRRPRFGAGPSRRPCQCLQRLGAPGARPTSSAKTRAGYMRTRRPACGSDRYSP
ncbi:hypothetical protein BC830DRAFT_1147366 [Chytriomyces sp. MP71]|nr:hypothetical protein BC830DRAFT_1147366 [Chytriomyces sp. MP71]